MNERSHLTDKQRIVIKIGSSSIIHEETGGVDFRKLEKLVRIICDLKNKGKEVILVSSGAIGVGFQTLGLKNKPKTVSLKQACAAIGQGQLMMMYQKLFMEYNHLAAQVLLTFDAITDSERRHNAENKIRISCQARESILCGAEKTIAHMADVIAKADGAAALDERIHGDGRHASALGRAIHALAVFVRTEDDDFAALLTERLNAFKALLPVVKACCSNMKRDARILDEFRL